MSTMFGDLNGNRLGLTFGNSISENGSQSVDTSAMETDTSSDGPNELDLFAAALKDLHANHINPIDVIQRYGETSSEKAKLAILQNSLDNEESDNYLLETRFWSLVDSLYRYRTSDIKQLGDIPSYASNILVQEKYLLENDAAKENWIILQWLQGNFPAVSGNNNELHGIKWINTRDRIQRKNAPSIQFSARGSVVSGGVLRENSTEVTTQLDLDAPLRQELPIAKEDAEFDRSVYKHIFDLLRANEIEEAERVCESTGNFSLSLVISGSHEYSDPEIDGPALNLTNINSTLPAGTENKGLWRRMCWQMAQQQNVDSYERAIYGFLSCDLETVLKVSNSWETQFFTYLSNIVAYQSEEILSRAGRIDWTSLQNLDGGALNSKATHVREVLDILAHSTNPVVKKQSESKYRILMGSTINRSAVYIIQSFSEFFDAAAFNDEIDEPEELIEDFALLRIVTHYALFLKSIGEDIGSDSSLATLVRVYVTYLAIEKRDYLAPLYISYLPDELAVETYSSLLVDINNPEQRREHLRLGAKYKLDMANTVRKVVDNVIKDTERAYDHSFGDFTDVIDEADERRIKGMQWYIEAGLWADAVYGAVFVFREFLSNGRYEAARAFGTDLGISAVVKTYESEGIANIGGESPEVPPGHKYELLEYDRLVKCLQLLNEWNVNLPKNVQSSPTSQLPQEWITNALDYVDRFGKSVYDLADTWMSDIVYEPETPEWQLVDQLRTRYVPFLILSHLNVLTEAQVIHRKFLKQTAELASLVADEKSKLYVLFLKSGYLEEFLRRLAVAFTDGLESGEQGVYETD